MLRFSNRKFCSIFSIFRVFHKRYFSNYKILEEFNKLSNDYKSKLEIYENKSEMLNYLANDLSKPYEELLNKFLENWKIPNIPKHFCFRDGWTKYDSQTNSFVQVPFPDDDVLIFDIEVVVKEGYFPSLAVCLGKNNWYSWVSKRLMTLDNSKGTIYSDELIPLFHNDSNIHRCIIGHFVSFDRARVANEYLIQGSNTRYIDTMSMHIAVSGMINDQLVMYNSQKNLQWKKVTSKNNLLEVFSLYNPKEIPPQNKDYRNIFVTGSSSDVVQNFQKLMIYCANDVFMTAKVFKEILPIFKSRFPHKSVFYGMLELNSLYLPTNDKWFEFINHSENNFKSLGLKFQKDILMKAARLSVELGKDQKYKNDPWLWDLNWKLNKGLPNWYRALFSTDTHCEIDNDEPSLISFHMNIAQKVLRLRWDDLPLYYDKTYKWGILAPISECNSNSNIVINVPDNFPKKEYFENYLSNNSNYSMININTNTFYFYPLTHKNGHKSYVSRPLSENFVPSFNNRLTSDLSIGQTFLHSMVTCQFWKSNNEIIKNQIIVKLNRLPENNQMAIIPLVVPISDVYRKIEERLWFNNFYLSKKIGAEYKSLIVAPENYVFVGSSLNYSVDWFIGIIGDSEHGKLGGSVFGKHVLNACYHNLTRFQSELYSNLSRITNIDQNIIRDLVKIMVLGGSIDDVAKHVWKNLIFNFNEAQTQATIYVKSLKGYKSNNIFQGGILSDYFNIINKIIKSDIKTPFLNSKVTRPVEMQSTFSNLLKVILRACLADYISSLIVYCKSFIIASGLESRLSICNNYEIRFLCHEKDKYKMAYTLHSADLLTKSTFTSLLSLGNLPPEFRFLNNVDIDKSWRMDPVEDFSYEFSNGIYHNYGIEPGVSINFDEIFTESLK